MGVCRPSDRSEDCDRVDCCEDSSKPSGPTGPDADEPVVPLEGGGGGPPGGPPDVADALLVGGVGPLCVDEGGIVLATEARMKIVFFVIEYNGKIVKYNTFYSIFNDLNFLFVQWRLKPFSGT